MKCGNQWRKRGEINIAKSISIQLKKAAGYGLSANGVSMASGQPLKLSGFCLSETLLASSSWRRRRRVKRLMAAKRRMAAGGISRGSPMALHQWREAIMSMTL
jgi:hypothetical protein